MGLGARIASVLHDAGAQVMSVARGASAVPASAIVHEAVDLREAESAQRVLDLAQRHFGGADILVNCAGQSVMERAERLGRADFDDVFRLNVTTVQDLSAAFVQQCRAAKHGGVILNVSSILARMPLRGGSAYAASKAALDQMTRVHALEWGRLGVRVNAIAPGWFETAMTRDLLSGPAGTLLRQKNPTMRLGEPGDLDGAVLLLVSDAGAYITGAILPVDGGQHLAG